MNSVYREGITDKTNKYHFRKWFVKILAKADVGMDTNFIFERGDRQYLYTYRQLFRVLFKLSDNEKYAVMAFVGEYTNKDKYIIRDWLRSLGYSYVKEYRDE
jgi:hypothetical protein